MPEPKEGESREDFLERCIPQLIDEGKPQNQATAICSQMWRDREKALALPPETCVCPKCGHEQEKERAEPCRSLKCPECSATMEAKVEEKGNALKAISRTDDELRIGNYAIVFGGRDLEGVASPRKNQDGSIGEFFTPKTALESDYTATGRLYVDWEHGRDPDPESPGRDEVLGYVDWSTAKADGRGLWVERVLNRRNAYMKWLEALVDEGLIGNSTEPVQSGVSKAENGEIQRWPLKRDTLTVTPMEPRMMSENALSALKGLAQEFPHVDTLAKAVASLEAGAEAGHIEDSAPDATATQTVDVNININVADKATPGAPDEEVQEPAEEVPKQEAITMSEEKKATEQVVDETPQPEPVDVAKIVADAAKAAAAEAATEAIRAYQKQLEEKEPVTNPGVATITDGRADRELKANPYKSFGEFLLDVARAGSHGIVAERLMPVKANDPIVENGFDVGKALGPAFVGRMGKAPTGLSETVPADGGFLVGTDRSAGLMSRVYDVGQLLQRVDMVGVSGGSNSMTFYAEDETSRVDGSRRGGIRAYWAAEAAEKTASAPKFREMELKLRKVVGLVYATDELLADAGALQSWILTNLPEELRFVVEDAIINGTGAGQPQGILQSNCVVSVAKETGQAATSFVAENAIKMWARLYAPSRRNAVWLINQDVEPQLLQMSLPVGTGGSLVYMPPGGLSGLPYGTLFGRPVVPSEYQPTLGTVGDVLLADLGEYQMIEKGGIESASSIHVRFVYDESCFRFVYRVDGQTKWNEALTPHNGSNSVSPFVSLAVRA